MDDDKWLVVNQKDINKPKDKKSNGVKVQVMISPSSVPSAVRSFLDKDTQKLVVEFKYLSSPEKLKSETGASGLQLFVGRNSGKIYKIIFDCKKIISEAGGKITLEMVLDSDSDLNSSLEVNRGNIAAIDNLLKSKYSNELVRA